MNSFKIIEYFKGEKSAFYSILFENEIYSEADKFFDEYSQIRPNEIGTIINKIHAMATKNSCQDIYFEPESSLDNTICKIKIGDVRLYCLRYSNVAVILGGGGIKNKGKKKTQDNPKLQSHVNILKEIFEFIEERRKNNDIWFTDKEIFGNLEF